MSAGFGLVRWRRACWLAHLANQRLTPVSPRLSPGRQVAGPRSRSLAVAGGQPLVSRWSAADPSAAVDVLIAAGGALPGHIRAHRPTAQCVEGIILGERRHGALQRGQQ